MKIDESADTAAVPALAPRLHIKEPFKYLERAGIAYAFAAVGLRPGVYV